MALDRYWVIGFGKPIIEFDAVLKESHTSEVVVTEEPIETGVPIADHAYMLADRLEVDIGIGDVWLRMRDPKSVDAFAVEEAAEGGDALAPLGPANQDFGWLTGDGDGDSTTRSQRAMLKLRNLQKSFAIIGVQTGLLFYPRLMVRTITTEQDKDSASALFARVTFSEPLFTTTETAAFPPRKAGKTKRQGAKKADKGEQKSKDATATQAESAAFAGFGDKVKGVMDDVLGAVGLGGP